MSDGISHQIPSHIYINVCQGPHCRKMYKCMRSGLGKDLAQKIKSLDYFAFSLITMKLLQFYEKIRLCNVASMWMNPHDHLGAYCVIVIEES